MIKIHNLCKAYDEKIILNKFSCEINDTGITAISGASGVGKTTLVRIIAGLEKADAGNIEGCTDKKISFLFQEDRLFEHLSTIDNVSLVSDVKTAKEILNKMELGQVVDLLPSQLSGGMCRRVSLARALAFNGDIIILDEPFKGLDERIKSKVLDIIIEYSQKHCVILITHDKEDLKIAENIIYL